jgi:hypothetical protein
MRVSAWFLMAVLSLSAGCTQKKTAVAPFDGSKFVIEMMQITQSNAELGRMATTRAWAPVTRQLGSNLAPAQAKMHSRLAAIASQRHIEEVPVQSRHVALRQNLDLLPGQVFDRGYALAMTQELGTLRRRCAAAAASDDAELARLAKELDPQLEQQQAQAQQVLDRNGGSPFAF